MDLALDASEPMKIDLFITYLIITVKGNRYTLAVRRQLCKILLIKHPFEKKGLFYSFGLSFGSIFFPCRVDLFSEGIFEANSFHIE